MGKAANRRKIAEKRKEKPNSFNDRVKLAVKKGEDNLSAMYMWHESILTEARAEHDKECTTLKTDHEAELKSTRIRYELKLQKSRNEKKELRQEKSDLKKQVSQAKEWVQLIIASHLTDNKRNTLLVEKASKMGICDVRDFMKLNLMMDDDEKCEDVLINPLIDWIAPKP